MHSLICIYCSAIDQQHWSYLQEVNETIPGCVHPLCVFVCSIKLQIFRVMYPIYPPRPVQQLCQTSGVVRNSGLVSPLILQILYFPAFSKDGFFLKKQLLPPKSAHNSHGDGLNSIHMLVQVSLDKSDDLVAKNPSGLSRIRVKEGYFSRISKIRRPKIVRVTEGPTYRSPTYQGTPVEG